MRLPGALSPLAVAAKMPNNLGPIEFYFNNVHGRQGVLAPCLGECLG